MFSHILVAYDGSDQSKKALTYIPHLAGNDTEIEVLHVYQNPVVIIGEAVISTPMLQKNYYEHEQAVEDELRELITDIPRCRSTILTGRPAQTIIEYSLKNGVDLIVIGSRGHTAIDELFLGSTSHHVVQHSQIPVLIVK